MLILKIITVIIGRALYNRLMALYNDLTATKELYDQSNFFGNFPSTVFTLYVRMKKLFEFDVIWQLIYHKSEKYIVKRDLY